MRNQISQGIKLELRDKYSLLKVILFSRFEFETLIIYE